MTDRSDALILRYDPVGRAPRRLRFEPTADGYERIEEVWNGCQWRGVGNESVDHLALENAEVLKA
jgi:hypothetical protein